ncbi:MAG: hypothetical protein VB078_07765 [Clostridiaceae bacterium]|nr:hypothetical protein [Clostridiaceae bacterium]
MGGSIKLYGGTKANMPKLPVRSPGYCTDSRELYIGGEEDNILLASAQSTAGRFERITLVPMVGEGELSQLWETTAGDLAYKNGAGKIGKIAGKATSVGPVSPSASMDELIAAFNGLIAALKQGGTMEG